MHRWLVIAALAVVCFAQESPVKEASEPVAESSSYLETDVPGPEVIRSLNHEDHLTSERIEKQNRVIRDVFSPDYIQPRIVLDYRYVKSDGRDYARADGGQILILPRGVRSDDKHKQFANYDELIEFLRLQNLAESEKELLHPNVYSRPDPLARY